jgi:hypothetical protein
VIDLLLVPGGVNHPQRGSRVAASN